MENMRRKRIYTKGEMGRKKHRRRKKEGIYADEGRFKEKTRRTYREQHERQIFWKVDRDRKGEMGRDTWKVNVESNKYIRDIYKGRPEDKYVDKLSVNFGPSTEDNIGVKMHVEKWVGRGPRCVDGEMGEMWKKTK